MDRPRLARLVEATPGVGLLVLVAVLGPLWAERLRYPFDLEWREGASLAQAWRLAQGLPLYLPPSSAWIPSALPPGHATLLALLGPDYASARALSLAATLLTTLTLAAWVGRSSRSWGAAATTGCVFLGGFAAVGAYGDLAHPDALALLLSVWAVAAVSAGERPRPVLAALSLVAATALQPWPLLTSPLLVALTWVHGGRVAALRLAGLSLVLGSALAAVGQALTEGHLLRYAWGVPAAQPLSLSQAWPRAAQEWSDASPMALAGLALWTAHQLPASGRTRALGLAAGAGLASTWARFCDLSGADLAGPAAVGALFTTLLLSLAAAARGRATPLLPALAFFVGLLILAAARRGLAASELSVHLPVLAGLAWGAGQAFSRVRHQGTAIGLLVSVAVAGGALRQAQQIQTAKLAPLAADRFSGERVVEALRRAPPGTASPYAPWLRIQAGHTDPGWHLASLQALEAPGGPYAAAAGAVRAAVEGGAWPGVLDGSPPLPRAMTRRLSDVRPLLLPEGSFEPRSGYPARPHAVRLPPPARDQRSPGTPGR